MHDLAGQPIADVDHGGGFQFQICDLADDVDPSFGFQLTLQQVCEIVELRLCGGCCLVHLLLPLQNLQPHVSRTKVATDHQEVPVAGAVSAHNNIRFHPPHGGDAQRQARCRGGGVSSHQVHLVDLAGQTNALVQLFGSLHRKTVAQPQTHHHLRWDRIHGTDVAEVDHHGFVSEVLERHIAQVEVDAFAQKVGADHHAFAHRVQHCCIVADTP